MTGDDAMISKSPLRCSSPTLISHKQIAPSLPPVANNELLKGSHERHLTVLVWPRRTCVMRPVLTSVILVDWSPEQVAIDVSSKFHLTSKIPLLCGWNVVL